MYRLNAWNGNVGKKRVLLCRDANYGIRYKIHTDPIKKIFGCSTDNYSWYDTYKYHCVYHGMLKIVTLDNTEYYFQLV